jgi:hypothetical protein
MLPLDMQHMLKAYQPIGDECSHQMTCVSNSLAYLPPKRPTGDG